MFAFMIAVVAVFVAVVISAVIDPRVDRTDDDGWPMDELTPAV